MTVEAIYQATGQGLSNASIDLSCLKEWGLVVSRREGKRRFYSVASEKVLGLLNDRDMVHAEGKRHLNSRRRYDR